VVLDLPSFGPLPPDSSLSEEEGRLFFEALTAGICTYASCFSPSFVKGGVSSTIREILLGAVRSRSPGCRCGRGWYYPFEAFAFCFCVSGNLGFVTLLSVIVDHGRFGHDVPRVTGA